MPAGKFIISLDMELMWGVRDSKSKACYGANILGVREAIPKLLLAFERYGVKSTFSVVGFLLLENRQELMKSLPDRFPEYKNSHLSPYHGYMENLGWDEKDDPYHFCSDLIHLIQSYPDHEIGTHTFSHYYCLEEGQTEEAFRADMQKVVEISKNKGISVSSLVFPKNQFNPKYLEICKEYGIICYRGNEASWLYEARNQVEESFLRRTLRFLDTYWNLSGFHCYSKNNIQNGELVNIPSSRFLRPFCKPLKALENWKLSRILDEMTYAAKNHLIYHLWWHPHNFGTNQKENFENLDKILSHYNKLNKKYQFASATMTQLAESVKRGDLATA